MEAVLHALASCIAAGFVYNAAAQGIKVEAIEMNLKGDSDLHGFLGLSGKVRPGHENIQINYHVKADATEEKIKELCVYVQKTSPVLDMIRNPVAISVKMEKRIRSGRMRKSYISSHMIFTYFHEGLFF